MKTTATNAHPKGLYMLFTTEMWERFNFYGMRSLFALFLVNAMAFSEKDASLIYGAYLGLSYLVPMLGGYVADNLWGTRKCILFGGTLMSLGQLCLFVSGSLYDTNFAMSKWVLWTGLGVLVLGNGFFKPNISSTVGKLYKNNDSRLDSAYTIFYMGINIGAFFGMAICPFLGDVYDGSGVRVVSAFRWGFLTAGGAMVLGTLIFWIFNKTYLKKDDGTPVGIPPLAHPSEGISEKGAEPTIAKFSKVSLVWSGIVFVVLLSIFYEVTAGGIVGLIYSLIYALGIGLAVLILFGDKSLTKVERDKIMVLYIVSFFVIFFWACFEQSGSSLTFVADYQVDRQFLGFDLPPSSLQNANSLFIMLLAFPFAFFWTWLEKKKLGVSSPVKQAIGLILLSIGYMVIAYQMKAVGISGKMSVLWMFLMYLLHTMGELCLSPIGLSLVSKLAPARFVSLLMGVWFLASASGYALSGTLGGMLPPTGDKYRKAEELGVSLSEVLQHKTTLSATQLQMFKAHGIPTEYPTIFGRNIESLYDFFLVFVALSFIAGLLLLFLSPKLKKMMHGIT